MKIRPHFSAAIVRLTFATSKVSRPHADSVVPNLRFYSQHPRCSCSRSRSRRRTLPLAETLRNVFADSPQPRHHFPCEGSHRCSRYFCCGFCGCHSNDESPRVKPHPYSVPPSLPRPFRSRSTDYRPSARVANTECVHFLEEVLTYRTSSCSKKAEPSWKPNWDFLWKQEVLTKC